MNSFKGKSTRLRVGCQTYTWEMLGDRWTGSADDLLAGIADGGYAGIEITDTMIGHYADRPEAFAAALEKHGLTLVAFACGSASGFTEPAARTAKRPEAWRTSSRRRPSSTMPRASAVGPPVSRWRYIRARTTTRCSARAPSTIGSWP